MRRRDLALALLAGKALAAQTTPPTATTPADDFAAAKTRIKRNSAELSAYAIPMATEPAFAFKA